MISLQSRMMVVALRIYVAVALVIATMFSPLAFSFIPAILLVWYLYLWRWPASTVIRLLTEYFMFFAIALLFAPPVGPLFSLLISLPLLLLIYRGLEENAGSITGQAGRYRRRPTNIALAFLLIAILLLGVSLLLGSLSLLLACAGIVSFFGVLGAISLRRLPLRPVEVAQARHRMVAGTEEHFDIWLTTKAGIGGLLSLESPYEWLKVSPHVMSLKEDRLPVKLSLSPVLSGPSVIRLNGHATDRWGLIQTSFEIEPFHLYVIPRARYAAWLVKKYLAVTKPEALPLVSNIGALKPIYALRRGVEYYGSRPYLPGDRLKDMDWKHFVNYDQLITKEFLEFQGQPAIMLINLAVGNAEEADKLAYNILVTAISLTLENIPAALAVYSHEGVKLTTPTLHPRQLLLQSLKIAQEMVTFINPVKYLSPPDIARLRTNISRIRFAESEASRVLAQLLQLEYKNFSDSARLNPATKTLAEAFSKVDKRSNIVIISQRNHDAEALAFNTLNFTRKGNTVINV